jgi:hypothetical protein
MPKMAGPLFRGPLFHLALQAMEGPRLEAGAEALGVTHMHTSKLISLYDMKDGITRLHTYV